MKRFVCSLLLVWAVPALAYSNDARLPYRGEAGQLPLAVVMDFLGPRLGADGRFEYRTLKVEQQSRPEAFDYARITVVREGLLDDSVRGNRWRFDVNLGQDGRWRIDRVQEDFSCWRSHAGWQIKPCR